MSAALLIADSGPLIALARLQRLSLPSELFGNVWVTETVWDEVTRQPRVDELHALMAAQQVGSFLVVPDHQTALGRYRDSSPDARAHLLSDPGLDPGEQSALALALATAATVLIDERRGRACAVAMQLPVLGTLGLLVRARDAGLIERVRPLADALSASGYFLGQMLVARTLASIGE